jgi:hypothetical protein
MRRAAILAVLLCAAGPAVAQTPPAASPPTAAPGVPPAPAPDAWLPRGGVELQALDKVTARTLKLSGRVGQAIHYGSLTITVRACVVRPPDQAADAAAFLDIADARPDMPRFSGWMLVSAPAVSMLEHPVYDIRMIGCLP